ncbi:DNA-3-methyladenine glycosylase [Bombilactobacillus bombi]|uniref:DNA-3-methyladenine glycosylase n=1 Tax=Bombilactobacillus bombi TaxID=1303590 RepID=UPI0015FAA8BC|nr:DNA-3-methyladenine glycosylase [Bombilactobacillus bombi]
MIATSFFKKDSTDIITQNLLGHELTYNSPKGIIGGLIVEAEAYMGIEDTAAHSFQGHSSPANEALYAQAGTIYIYSIYGHYMLDVATQKVNEPQGILIRALQPTHGIKIMEQNRQQKGVNLTNGPGKLMAALGINSLELNLCPLQQTPLDISNRRVKCPQKIIAAPRVNVSQGTWHDRPLRFYVANNPYVSGIKKRDCDFQTNGWQ